MRRFLVRTALICWHSVLELDEVYAYIKENSIKSTLNVIASILIALGFHLVGMQQNAVATAANPSIRQLISQARSCQIPYSKENLINFSEPGEIDPYIGETRVITANSILNGLKMQWHLSEGLVEYFRGLLKKNPQNATEVEKKFTELINNAYFVRRTDESYGEFYELADPELGHAKSRLRQMVAKSILSISNVEWQSLIIFLAALTVNHSRLTQEKRKIVVVFSDDGEPEMEYPVLDISGQETYDEEYPCFSSLLVASPPTEYGEIKVRDLIYGDTLCHELNHGTHTMLGLGEYSRQFVHEYMQNPFLKELFFNGLENIETHIRMLLSEKLKSINDVVSLEQFEKNIMGTYLRFFLTDNDNWALGALSIKIAENKDKFIEELSYKLALVTIFDLWHKCPEEINNVVGIQFINGILFVNTLSDMDASLELGNQVTRWPYTVIWGPISTEEPQLNSVGAIPSTVEIEHWFEQFTSFARILNFPTEQAWSRLIQLHR
ncbi:MAG: hypothetical protein LBC04_02060 [Holosporaceae bacterium]|jgi:hypothetical protein|nr:hypothetical protein [Holosporaceae bacterium]